MEEASDFVRVCRQLAAGGRSGPCKCVAAALLDYVRRPLPEKLDVWLEALGVSTASAAFRVVHRAVRAGLMRYEAMQIERSIGGREAPRGKAIEAEWMEVVAPAEVTEAFAPLFSPAEAQQFWRVLGEVSDPRFGFRFSLERLRRFLLPPSPFPLALVVDIERPGKGVPALFAVRLGGGRLQPVGDWIQAHWQEPEQLHALAEQWHALIKVCFTERACLEFAFHTPFTMSAECAEEMLSEAFSDQLAWFNCVLCGHLPNRVRCQDIVVRGRLGERSVVGEFTAEALLDFSYEVVVNGRPLSKQELAHLIEGDVEESISFGENFLPADLAEQLFGELQMLRELEIAFASEGLSFFEGLRLLAGLPIRGSIDAGAFPRQFQAGEQLARFLSGADAPPMPALPEATAQRLRPYQLEGVRFLWSGTARGLGVCLADDMGLGKTLQVLALLQLWQRAGLLAQLPALVIVPPSLLETWLAEQQRWAPELVTRICHPKWMEKAEWQRLVERPGETLRGVEVALMSYQMVPRVGALQRLELPAIILDEAQAIKAPGSQQSQAVRALTGQRRIVLTGTPVENSLLDLWTLFDFLNPGLLGPQESIRQMCRTPEAFTPALRQLVRPFLLRRAKGDPGILEELPDKEEQLVPCALTPAQALAYHQIVEILRAGLARPMDRFARGALVLRTLVRLKQVCNHPSQLIHNPDYPPEASGKFLKLLELAGQIVASGEKFLLFTQFYEIIAPLNALLSERLGCPGFVLHGSTPVEARKARVEAFQHQAGPAFFIISLRAGGFGLTLTAATHVIHFDRWWNPAVENQATDRAHRIGQHHRVTVHKFICYGTLEERIDALIRQKRALADKLLRAGPEKLITAMSNAELLDLVCLAPTEEAR